uniref:Uncharacterized protein n=1 Tax=Oryza rufipogon TaxID=4529 RepID=A0A0E0PQ26_ORYRU
MGRAVENVGADRIFGPKQNRPQHLSRLPRPIHLGIGEPAGPGPSYLIQPSSPLRCRPRGGPYASNGHGAPSGGGGPRGAYVVARDRPVTCASPTKAKSYDGWRDVAISWTLVQSTTTKKPWTLNRSFELT